MKRKGRIVSEMTEEDVEAQIAYCIEYCRFYLDCRKLNEQWRPMLTELKYKKEFRWQNDIEMSHHNNKSARGGVAAMC